MSPSFTETAISTVLEPPNLAPSSRFSVTNGWWVGNIFSSWTSRRMRVAKAPATSATARTAAITPARCRTIHADSRSCTDPSATRASFLAPYGDTPPRIVTAARAEHGLAVADRPRFVGRHIQAVEPRVLDALAERRRLPRSAPVFGHRDAAPPDGVPAVSREPQAQDLGRAAGRVTPLPGGAPVRRMQQHTVGAADPDLGRVDRVDREEGAFVIDDPAGRPAPPCVRGLHRPPACADRPPSALVGDVDVVDHEVLLARGDRVPA